MTHREGVIFPSNLVRFLEKKNIFISEKAARKFLHKLEAPVLTKRENYWSHPNRHFRRYCS